jgi:hypothetical protein
MTFRPGIGRNRCPHGGNEGVIMFALDEVARQRRDGMLAEAQQRRRMAQMHALNRARRRAERAERVMSRARVEVRRLGRELEARA